MQKHWDSYESLDWGNEVRSLEEKIKGIFITTGFLPTTGSSPDIALVVDLAEVYFEFKKYDYFSMY